ncbi:MAG: V-type ATP synthase subunit I [Oscillospiraceae bacterium]
MSIVKMKALTLLAPSRDVKMLLRTLQHFGCVEVGPAEEDGFMPLASRADMLRAFSRDVEAALEIMKEYAPQKKSFLAPRPTVPEEDFWDKTTWRGDVRLAREVNGHAQTIQAIIAKEAEFRARDMSLVPWQAYPLPLDYPGTKQVKVIPGTLPAKTELEALRQSLWEEADESELFVLSEDKELKYLALVVHESQEKEAVAVLRNAGFSLPVWKDFTGTVAENRERIRRELAAMQRKREQEKQAILDKSASAPRLVQLQDRIRQYLAREEATERLRAKGAVTLLKGWLPAEKEEEFRALMDGTDCAWELREPTEEEYPDVPVSLKNNRLTRPLNMVTEMYSLPAYNGVDPNPLMAPFFILFYGFMLADMGYGLLMMLASYIIMKRTKPNGPTTQYMVPLAGLCGFSTFVVGAMTGGFFGDMIPQLIRLFNPESTFALPALFSPLDDALMVLVGSLGLGLVQIFTGMIISMRMKCKRGDVMGALMAEGAWFLVFACIGVGAVLGAWKQALIAALVIIVLTQGYGKKGILGKLMGIGGSLYNNITGYFSDILSYSRLMALMLAGAVIAQVFNTLGNITGNIVTFFLISMVGNALNLALNLLGCYVHDMRLQCLEFFGRFYEDGGKPFRPLEVKTQFVDIVKE